MQPVSKDSSKSARFLPGYITLVFSITLIGIGLSVTRPYLSLFGTNVIHMNPAQLGIFMCVNAIGGIVASTWLGKLSDSRIPKKDIILFSSLCAGIGYAVFLFIHNYWWLLTVSTLFLGLGSAAFPLIFAYARESTSNRPGHDATFAISLLRSFFSLAWVIGPLFGIWILQAYQFNGLFRFTVLIFVLVFILVIFRLQRRMTAMPGQATKTTSTPLLQHFRRYEVWTTCISFIAVSTSLSINGLFMPLFVTKTLHASAHVVGGMFSLCAGLEIPFMLLLGKLASRLGKRQLLLTGSIFGTFYYTCASFAHAPWQMLSLQAVYAVFISISVSIGMSYMQDFIPDSPGSATTLFSNTNNIGAMAGSLVGGIIAESFGYRYVYVFCAVLGVISYLFLLRRRTQSQPYVSAPSLHTQEENF